VRGVAIRSPESSEQREWEVVYVGWRDDGAYTSPIAQREIGMKGSRDFANGPKTYRNPERIAKWFGDPSPAGFVWLTLE
jgi:hypothetical protein